MGKIRRAYALNDHDAEALMAAMWPHGIFPFELWRDAYGKFWRGLAEKNAILYYVDNPVFPEIDSVRDKYFYVHICADAILKFFRNLATTLHVDYLSEGLKYIFSLTYDDIVDDSFQEEMTFLFNRLSVIENNSRRQHDTIINADEFVAILEEKILNIPPGSYDFIAHIFPDTILVDAVAAIRQLHAFHYPLRQEVKGITRDLVDSVVHSRAREIPAAPETAASPAEPAAEMQPTDQENIIRVDASLWQGKPDAAVRDAMKADYDIAVIAYVLLNWCGANKTRVGKLLSEEAYEDDKSYRNFVDRILKKIASFAIIKA